MQGLMIGVTGEFLSGKSTITRIIKKRFPGTPSARYSDALREYLQWVNIKFSGHQIFPSGGYSCIESELKKIFYPEVLERTVIPNALPEFVFWMITRWGGKYHFCVKEDRTNLQELSTVLRSTFAENILERAVASRIEKMQSPTPIQGIIEGVRRLVDIGTLLNDPLYRDRFKLLYLECTPEVAFHRMQGRKENTDDATMTWEQFQLLRSAEAENQIQLLRSHAHALIHNNETEKVLSASLDVVVDGWISE